MGRGAGYGRGRGLRCGLRRGFGPENLSGFQINQGMTPPSNPQNLQTEIERLQSRTESMQHTLDAINERLAEMEKSK